MKEWPLRDITDNETDADNDTGTISGISSSSGNSPGRHSSSSHNNRAFQAVIFVDDPDEAEIICEAAREALSSISTSSTVAEAVIADSKPVKVDESRAEGAVKERPFLFSRRKKRPEAAAATTEEQEDSSKDDDVKDQIKSGSDSRTTTAEPSAKAVIPTSSTSASNSFKGSNTAEDAVIGGVSYLSDCDSLDERAEALASFRTGASTVLVSSELAARGLDVPSISHVLLVSNLNGYM
jgi:hypothetical protein